MPFEQISPGNGSQNNGNISADIVTIHGLGGHIRDTWTHASSSCFWPEQCLPRDIPSARVFAYGYNADVAFGNTTADVEDYAKDLLAGLLDRREGATELRRPLVFVAHSLGGIIVKQALIRANVDPKYKLLLESTKGVVFFGTPHRGSEKAKYGDVLATVAAAATRKQKTRLCATLKTNSEALFQVTDQFKYVVDSLKIVSFYESKPTWPSSTPIVSKDSALLMLSNEDELPVDANHLDICKFPSRSDDTYDKMQRRIKRMLGLATANTNESKIPSPSKPKPVPESPLLSMAPSIPVSVHLTQIQHGGSDPAGDIVFIHGLFGDSRDTWTYSGPASPRDKGGGEHKHGLRFWKHRAGAKAAVDANASAGEHGQANDTASCYWPLDILARDFADHRIFTVQYVSDIEDFLAERDKSGSALNIANALLTHIADRRTGCHFRPLAFVCHSLGGCIGSLLLMNLQQLCPSSETTRWIFESVYSVTYFGTPGHRHAVNALHHLATTAAKAEGVEVDEQRLRLYTAEAWKGAVQARLLKILDETDLCTAYFHDAVEKVSPPAQTHGSLRLKAKATEVQQKLAVTKVSAKDRPFDHPCAFFFSVSCPHRDLVRFHDAQDLRYLSFRNELEKHFHRFVSLWDKKVDKCLQSLHMPDMYIRASQIEEATEGTLQWLFKPDAKPDLHTQDGGELSKSPSKDRAPRTPGLHTWLQSQNSMFWLTGKPGSGKSTAMKYISMCGETSAILNRIDAQTEWHIIGFFFTDRGGESQRSWTCMLHAIIYELLRAVPELARTIVPIGLARKPGKHHFDPEQQILNIYFDWSLASSLETALMSCKEQKVVSFRTLLLVDALDEHDGDHSSMAAFLRRLGQPPTAAQNTHIKICVASRTDELKSFLEDCPGFSIHKFTRPDIDAYVKYRTKRQQRMQQIMQASDEATKGRARALIRSVGQRAQGVFLWVRLVVDELVRLLALGKPLEVMEKALKDLPEELDDFFMHMLKRIDSRCLREANTIFDSVLRARTPLTVLQVAMTLYVNMSDSGANVGLIDNSVDLERLIRSCTGELLEIMPPVHPDELDREDSENDSQDSQSTSSSGNDQPRRRSRAVDIKSIAMSESAVNFGKWTVQPIHQTVKDFLIKHKRVGEVLMDNVPVDDPCRALHNGHVFILKFCYWWLDPVTVGKDLMDSITNVNDVCSDILYHCQAVDKMIAENDECRTRLMELLTGLDDRMSRFRSLDNRLWPMNWVREINWCYNVMNADQFNFLAFAVAFNLHNYVDHRLTRTVDVTSVFVRPPAKPLLFWAVTCLGHNRGRTDNPQMIAQLLRVGCQPRETLETHGARPRDALACLIGSVLVGHDWSIIAKSFTRSCMLLLDAGADANAIICDANLLFGKKSLQIFDMSKPVFQWSPIAHLACSFPLSDEQRFVIFEAFVKHGLDFKVEDCREGTLLEVLFDSEITMPTAMWLWLLQKGARVTRIMAKCIYVWFMTRQRSHPLLHPDCRQPQYYTWRGREVARKYNPEWQSSAADHVRRASDAILPTHLAGGLRTVWSTVAEPTLELIERKASDFRRGYYS